MFTNFEGHCIVSVEYTRSYLKDIMEELQRTGEKLYESIAYGDSAGLCVETRSFDFIRAKHGWINKLMPIVDNSYCLRDYPEGTTSDDTQLSLSVGNALVRSNGFDMQSQSDELVNAYHDTPRDTTPSGRVITRFWGGSTTGAAENLIAGASPYESGTKGGEGNGVIMKMAPLVYWQFAQCLSDKERYRQYDELTTMTHDSAIARVCTRVHGDVLFNLLLEDKNMPDFMNRAQAIAKFHEEQLGVESVLSNELMMVGGYKIMDAGEIEDIYRTRYQDVPEERFGKSYGFYVPETLAIAYSAFRIGSGDYHKSVYTAVNLGGDADSTASIVGTMVNFLRRGEQAMPDDIDKIEDLDKLRKMSRELANVALR